MALTTLDLVYLYIYRFYNEEPSRAERKALTKDMCILLQNGWTDKDLNKAIRENTNKVPILNLIAGRSQTDKNIMDPYTFYYHNQLRVTSEVKVELKKEGDYETELIQQQVDYFLEFRASYTVNDIVNYYIKELKIPPVDVNKERFIGAFNYFLKKYSLDLILYMIDTAYTVAIENDEKPPSNPMEISNYIDKARVVLEAKRTETRESGDDRFVPRKRQLDFGSRSKTAK